MPVSDAIAPTIRVPVTIHESADPAGWDRFVEQHPDATGYHLWGWRAIFEEIFGHRAVYLAAEQGGVTSGVLPLVEFRSALFGRFLVSLPFVNYGGVLALNDVSGNALLARAASLARKSRMRHVELRHRSRRFEGLRPKEHKVSMLLPLPDSTEGFWTRLDRKVRNQVRKAEKSGLRAEVTGLDRLSDFYGVFARNMRDLGTPVYSPRFFDAVVRAFPDRTRIVIVRDENSGRPVAAALTWRWRDTVEVPWASSLREFNALAPNNLLYWTIIQEAIGGGASVLDFGRSTPGEGTFHFKRQWGAEPLPLCWEYDLIDGVMPDQSPKNPKFRVAIEAWKRLPLGIANRLGPHIVRSIP